MSRLVVRLPHHPPKWAKFKQASKKEGLGEMNFARPLLLPSAR